MDLFKKTNANKKYQKKNYKLKRLRVNLIISSLVFSLLISYIPVLANPTTLTIDNEVHYTLNGEVEDSLIYGRMDFTHEDAAGIHLNVTKWAKLSTDWGNIEDGPYHGRFLLNFFLREFYTQIESIEVNGVQFEKEANGALWKVPINVKTFSSGLIGVVTNDDVIIKLKNGATLTSLGLADVKIDFTTVWVRGDGKADINGYDNGFILKNNPNIKPLPTNVKDGNQYYLGTGLNSITNSDGTLSRDGNFNRGHASKNVVYDAKNQVIKSIVTFKNDQNFKQANSGWVIYINEIIPQVILKYIDTDNVYLGTSDPQGNFTRDNPIKIVVDPNGNGHISTKDTPALSIVGADWNKVLEVRDLLDKQVFWGALGQRRSYTIQYKIKPEYSNIDLARILNEYIALNNDNFKFESWMEADFVDSTNTDLSTRKPDGGKPNKMLQNSYSNGFLEVLDTDKDGLYDFVEEEVGSNKWVVDTDGDGVPDNVEVLIDKTSPIDAKSYLVVAPNITTTNIEANIDQTITGTVPKTIYNNPANLTEQLPVTNVDAGNVIVRAYLYDENVTDYSTHQVKGQTSIPFADLTSGNFTLNIPAGTFADGDRVVLVAYSPDGKNPMISTQTVLVGANKVSFDVNGGQWSDGTTADKLVEIIHGSAVQPEMPIKEGYKFLGWASTSNALEAEAGVLNNLTTDKKVYAVWQAIPAKVTNSIQEVIEKQQIKNVVITVTDPAANIVVDTTKLPNGVTYDSLAKTISGAPNITDWGLIEETREFNTTITITYGDATSETRNVSITVLRDTDGDGEPDITDIDDDGDGYTDDEEINAGTNPKDPNSKPATTVDAIASVKILPTTQTVIDKELITDVVITPDDDMATVVVDETQLPNGVTYNATTKTISGKVNITDWSDNSDEKRTFEITVTVNNSDGSSVVKTVTISVLRDTDGDGEPDITDLDDDGDGFSDVDEIAVGTDPKDPNSKPDIIPPVIEDIANQNVIEGNSITNIIVNTDDPTAVITVVGLPFDVNFDSNTNTISGIPIITDWGVYESRDFVVTVKAVDPAGNVTTKSFTITVLRDTDKDGIPDITDSDDDGDGFSDVDELAAGTDPKDPTSVIPTTITNSPQEVIETNAIQDIVINNPNGTTVSFNAKFPLGIDYDANTKTITGTPVIDYWGADESITLEIPVIITNDTTGASEEKTISITVLRDTDKDGIPDTIDSDDDGDGFSDVDELAAGTDPKDPTSVIPTTITNSPQEVIETNPIKNVVINNPTGTTLTVDKTKLPTGLSYDETSKIISGTISITDWGLAEEERLVEIPVTITNDITGVVDNKTVSITVLRDTDKDGIPDTIDTDDDGDGFSDVDEIVAGTDPKDPTSFPDVVGPKINHIDNQTVIEKNPITSIVVGTDDPNALITVSGLPNYVTYDAASKTISGTPVVDNWGTDEVRGFEVTVEATDQAANKTSVIFTITVQRDTDGDGIADIIDLDDDGDGVSDVDEIAAGTDPKDPTSFPDVIPPVISDVQNQTIVERNPIADIVVSTDDPTAIITVSGLPKNLIYDANTKTISGTPIIYNWDTDETRSFEITITAVDAANNQATKTFTITVNRDTDGDGYSDIEEIKAGSDPKDPYSVPKTGYNAPFTGDKINILGLISISIVSGILLLVALLIKREEKKPLYFKI